MHQEILETTKKVKCSVITFFQAGRKILKAKALKALCVTGANEENSANGQVQDNLITLTSVFSCMDFTSYDSTNQVCVYLPEF